MTPLPGFVDTFMPKQFVEAGYHDTAAIGDATEIGFLSLRIDLNNITFPVIRTIPQERFVHERSHLGSYSIVLRNNGLVQSTPDNSNPR